MPTLFVSLALNEHTNWRVQVEGLRVRVASHPHQSVIASESLTTELGLIRWPHKPQYALPSAFVDAYELNESVDYRVRIDIDRWRIERHEDFRAVSLVDLNIDRLSDQFQMLTGGR